MATARCSSTSGRSRPQRCGYLPKLGRISSVSGGSITAAFLGLQWKRLKFDPQGVATNFDQEVVLPLRRLASTTIDRDAILGGIFSFDSIGERLTAIYQKELFGNATLQDLPDGPRFIINATNVQSGALFRFSKAYIRDYRVGKIAKPETPARGRGGRILGLPAGALAGD